MKVAVVNNQTLFVRGGAELLAEKLVAELCRHGHEAELVRIPFEWQTPAQVLDCVAACRLLRFPEYERLIPLKFPVYYVSHPSKVVWLLHQFRQVYDLWNGPFGLPPTSDARALRATLTAADTTVLGEATRLYTNSRVTSERLERYNGLASTVLLPPAVDPTAVEPREHGSTIVYPSRISELKRQHLVIEALAHTSTPVRLTIAGRPDSAQAASMLRRQVEDYGIADRVTIIDRWITDEERAELYSDALACTYVPVDEDSYGFVTLEAYAAERPVITCTDSGGTLDLVRDHETGIVVPPIPKALAAAMDSLYRDRALARALGRAGRKLVGELDLSWDRVVRTLTS